MGLKKHGATGGEGRNNRLWFLWVERGTVGRYKSVGGGHVRGTWNWKGHVGIWKLSSVTESC